MRVLRVAHHGVVGGWRARERELRALGDDVALISARRWNEGGRTVELDAADDRFVRGVSTVGTHPNAFLYDPFPMARALRHPIDLLDIHEEPFSLATAEILGLKRLRRNRAPYVVYSAQNIDKRYPVPFRWFERWALRGAAGAYVCNREAGEILRRKGLRGLVELIPLGVDLAHFRPAERTAPADPSVVGYVGRLEPQKGVEVLLRAAALRPSWRVEVTGDGPEQERLVRLAADLGLTDRIAFLGFASGPALAERYRRLDAIAVPSVPTPSWLEQFCRVAVEAMASGVPVVASRSGAIPDVVGGAGLLVEPGDPAALAAALDTALQPEEWTRLRALGLERAQGFTWERVAEQQHDLYRRVSGAAQRMLQVVVVAYGDPGMLAEALAHLGTGDAVTIVDNSSSEVTRDLATAVGAHYIDAGANLGFGAAVNVALRSLAERGLSGHDVLLLNPDALVGAADVARMHEEMRRHARTAAVGAAQVDPSSGESVRVWWPFPHPLRTWIEAIGLGRLNRARDFAIGSVLLLRAEALAEVGAFDERFFLYAEEVDWQKRARDRGWRVAVVPTSASHVGGGTSDDGGLRDQLFHASGEKYIRKHFGPRGWRIHRAAVLTGSAVRAVVLPGERGRAARRRFDLYRRGPVAALDRRA